MELLPELLVSPDAVVTLLRSVDSRLADVTGPGAKTALNAQSCSGSKVCSDKVDQVDVAPVHHKKKVTPASPRPDPYLPVLLCILHNSSASSSTASPHFSNTSSSFHFETPFMTLFCLIHIICFLCIDYFLYVFLIKPSTTFFLTPEVGSLCHHRQ